MGPEKFIRALNFNYFPLSANCLSLSPSTRTSDFENSTFLPLPASAPFSQNILCALQISSLLSSCLWFSDKTWYSGYLLFSGLQSSINNDEAAANRNLGERREKKLCAEINGVSIFPDKTTTNREWLIFQIWDFYLKQRILIPDGHSVLSRGPRFSNPLSHSLLM